MDDINITPQGDENSPKNEPAKPAEGGSFNLNQQSEPAPAEQPAEAAAKEPAEEPAAPAAAEAPAEEPAEETAESPAAEAAAKEPAEQPAETPAEQPAEAPAAPEGAITAETSETPAKAPAGPSAETPAELPEEDKNLPLDVPTETAEPAESSEGEPPKDEKKGISKIVLIGGGILAAVVALAAGLFFSGNWPFQGDVTGSAAPETCNHDQWHPEGIEEGFQQDLCQPIDYCDAELVDRLLADPGNFFINQGLREDPDATTTMEDLSRAQEAGCDVSAVCTGDDEISIAIDNIHDDILASPVGQEYLTIEAQAGVNTEVDEGTELCTTCEDMKSLVLFLEGERNQEKYDVPQNEEDKSMAELMDAVILQYKTAATDNGCVFPPEETATFVGCTGENEVINQAGECVCAENYILFEETGSCIADCDSVTAQILSLRESVTPEDTQMLQNLETFAQENACEIPVVAKTVCEELAETSASAIDSGDLRASYTAELNAVDNQCDRTLNQCSSLIAKGIIADQFAAATDDEFFENQFESFKEQFLKQDGDSVCINVEDKCAEIMESKITVAGDEEQPAVVEAESDGLDLLLLTDGDEQPADEEGLGSNVLDILGDDGSVPRIIDSSLLSRENLYDIIDQFVELNMITTNQEFYDEMCADDDEIAATTSADDEDDGGLTSPDDPGTVDDDDDAAPDDTDEDTDDEGLFTAIEDIDTEGTMTDITEDTDDEGEFDAAEDTDTEGTMTDITEDTDDEGEFDAAEDTDTEGTVADVTDDTDDDTTGALVGSIIDGGDSDTGSATPPTSGGDTTDFTLPITPPATTDTTDDQPADLVSLDLRPAAPAGDPTGQPLIAEAADAPPSITPTGPEHALYFLIFLAAQFLLFKREILAFIRRKI